MADNFILDTTQEQLQYELDMQQQSTSLSVEATETGDEYAASVQIQNDGLSVDVEESSSANYALKANVDSDSLDLDVEESGKKFDLDFTVYNDELYIRGYAIARSSYKFTFTLENDSLDIEQDTSLAIGRYPYFTKEETLQLLSARAAWGSTLSSYGIKDAYIDGRVIRLGNKSIVIPDAAGGGSSWLDDYLTPIRDKAGNIIGIHSILGFASDSFVSAGGLDGTDDEGGSGIDEALLWELLGSDINEQMVSAEHISSEIARRSELNYLSTQLDSKVPNSRTIAGLALNADISAEALAIALDLGKYTLKTEFEEFVELFGSMFQLVPAAGDQPQYIRALLGFASDSFVSAGGLDGTDDEGGSGINEALLWELLGSDINEQMVSAEHISSDIARKSELNYLSTQLDSKVPNSRTIAGLALNADISAEALSIALDLGKYATEDFVNSSIATNTATFRGTFETSANLPTTNVKANDYAFVVVGGEYQRYKYNGSAWAFEYTLNNSSYTAAQWAAINSGITEELVEKIEVNEGNISQNAAAIAKNASDIKGLSSQISNVSEIWNYVPDDIQEGDVFALEGDLNNKLDQSIWDSVFEIDEDGNLRAKVGLYSTSFISSRESDPNAGSGGGGAASALYTWNLIKAMTAEESGVAPTAYALKEAYSELNTKIDNISVPSLSGYATEAWVLNKGYITSAALPTKTSDLTNDSGFITSSAIPTSYAWSAITGKPSFAAVATSGSYNDLSNKPTIPTIPSTYAWTAITGTPTTLSGYGITDKVAYRETWNNFIHNSNEFTFVSAAYSGYVWLNYRTASGGSDGAITEYRFAKGEGVSFAALRASSYVVNGGTSSQFLKADGSLDSTAYLPTSGGTMTGDIVLPDNKFIRHNASDGYALIGVGNNEVLVGATINPLRLRSNGISTINGNTIIHSGNIGSYNAGSATKLAGSYLYTYDKADNPMVAFQGSGQDLYYIQEYQNGLWLGHSSHQATMVLNSSGNVLIGTIEDAGYKLNVKGSARFTDLTIGGVTSSSTYKYSGIGQQLPDVDAYSWYTIYSYSGDDGDSATITITNNYYHQRSNAVTLLVNTGWNADATITQLAYTGLGSFAVTEARVRYVGGVHYVDVRIYNAAYATDKFTVFGTGKGNFNAPVKVTDASGIVTSLTLAKNSMVLSGNLSTTGTIHSSTGIWTEGYLTGRGQDSSSDRRLKDNITPLRNALNYVLGTNYVSFDWKDTREKSIGIIAQEEIGREFGFLVQKNTEHYSYLYGQHTAILGAALQEEDKKVEELKTQIQDLKDLEVKELKAEILFLKAKVNELETRLNS